MGEVVSCPGCHNNMVVPAPKVTSGMQIGEFVVVRQIGAGGMGEVWLADQPALQRSVALKILSPELVKDDDFINRFYQEVRITGGLNHPNLVTAYAAGSDKGLYYLASYYVDGIELKRRLIIERKLPQSEALHIVRSIASALDYAWKKNRIIHRDIKPSNIMLESSGNPMLMDLGISKSINENTELTITGFTVGTPHYMSPEQARGEKNIDCRADIYSLGATMFHVLTGEVPYKGETLLEVLASLLSNPLPSVTALNDQVSENCEALLELMLAKDPEERPKDWEELLVNIDRVIAGKSPLLPRPNSIGPDQSVIRRVRRARQRRWVLTLLISTVVLLSGGLVWLETHPVNGEKTTDVTSGDGLPVSESESGRDGTNSDESSGTPTVPVSPGYDEQQAEESWQVAEKFGREALLNRKNLEQALSTFNRIKQLYPGTKYDLMADIEMAEIEKLKGDVIRDTLYKLYSEAEVLAVAHKYDEAVFLLQNYSGDFASELQNDLNEKAALYREQKKKYLEEQEALRRERLRLEMEANLSRERERIRREVAEATLFDQLGEMLANGKASTAYRQLQQHELVNDFPKVLSVLENLANPARVMDSYYRRIRGRSIQFTVDNQRVSGRVQGVDQGQLILERPLADGGSVTVNIPFKKLPLAQRLSAYQSEGPPVSLFYRLILNFRNGKGVDRNLVADLALNYDSDLMRLRDALIRGMSEVEASAAYRDFMGRLGVDPTVIGSSKESTAIAGITVKTEDRQGIRTMLAALEAAHGSSLYFTTRQASLDAVKNLLKRQEVVPLETNNLDFLENEEILDPFIDESQGLGEEKEKVDPPEKRQPQPGDRFGEKRRPLKDDKKEFATEDKVPATKFSVELDQLLQKKLPKKSEAPELYQLFSTFSESMNKGLVFETIQLETLQQSNEMMFTGFCNFYLQSGRELGRRGLRQAYDEIFQQVLLKLKKQLPTLSPVFFEEYTDRYRSQFTDLASGIKRWMDQTSSVGNSGATK